MSVSQLNNIKPWFRDDIFSLILSIARANPNPEREFIRALECVALAVGISADELRNGQLKKG